RPAAGVPQRLPRPRAGGVRAARPRVILVENAGVIRAFPRQYRARADDTPGFSCIFDKGRADAAGAGQAVFRRRVSAASTSAPSANAATMRMSSSTSPVSPPVLTRLSASMEYDSGNQSEMARKASGI